MSTPLEALPRLDIFRLKKRFPENSSWDEVRPELIQFAHLDATSEVKIYYQDDEGDWVIIGTPLEWFEAIRLTNGLLRLKLEGTRITTAGIKKELSQTHGNNHNDAVQQEQGTHRRDEKSPELRSEPTPETDNAPTALNQSFSSPPNDEDQPPPNSSLKSTLEKAVDLMKDEIEKLPYDIMNLLETAQTKLESLSRASRRGFRTVRRLAQSLHEYGLSKLDDISNGAAAVKILQAAAMIGGRRTPTFWYNAACALSKVRKQDEALATLAQAVEFGWSRPDLMRTDPDLDFVRSNELFSSLIEAAEKNKHEQQTHSDQHQWSHCAGSFFSKVRPSTHNAASYEGTTTSDDENDYEDEVHLDSVRETTNGANPPKGEERQERLSTGEGNDEGRGASKRAEQIVDGARKVVSKALRGFAGMLEGLADELNQQGGTKEPQRQEE